VGKATEESEGFLSTVCEALAKGSRCKR